MPRSKKKITFIQYMNKKYAKELNYPERTHLFEHFDDYIMWLWYEKFNRNDEEYYSRLEDDMMEYSNMQTEYDRNANNEK